MGETTSVPEPGEGFAGAATSFAELDELIWNPISMAAVARAHPQFDELVLDAGAGDGASALPTAELVGIGGLVDAVDPSAELIEVARERAGERMPQLQMHVADPATWETTGYDLVQSVLGVVFFADLDEGTRHLIERARPGGRVAITVWAHGALEPLPEVLAGALPDGGEDLDADALHPDIEELHTAGSLAHWLTGLGLAGVRAEAVQRHVDLTDEIAWALVLGTGMRAMLGDIEDDDEAVAGVRERYLAELAAREVASVDLTTLIAVGLRPEGDESP